MLISPNGGRRLFTFLCFGQYNIVYAILNYQLNYERVDVKVFSLTLVKILIVIIIIVLCNTVRSKCIWESLDIFIHLSFNKSLNFF